MTDISQYKNPLLKQLSDSFNLGIVFDGNGNYGDSAFY